MKQNRLILLHVVLLAWACIASASETRASDSSRNRVIDIGNAELAVVLGAKPSPAEKRVAELLAERIKDRTGVTLAGSGGKAKFRLVIGTVASHERIKAFSAGRKDIISLGADGYCIAADVRKGELYVIGQSDSGVVAGVGRLMREMRYTRGKIELPALQIAETPQMPNRGMYLWARKHFFGKPDQVDRYIEEFALWGCNGLTFWFEMGMFNSFDDPQAKHWLAMYKRFYATARRMGMKTGLLMVVNDAYKSSPKKLRISPIIGCPNHYLCPSKPGSVKQMIAWQEQVLKALSPIDIYNLFPADPGGCTCADCTPWPTRGYWRIAKPLAERIHKLSPKTEIWVDTWHLNHKTFGDKDWKNLVANIAKDRPAWFAGFEVGLAPHHRFAAMSAEERKYYNKAKAPLMVFPDISMWGNHRGMLVNRKYWKSLQAELNDYDPKLMKGGWPYSERWNTDIASVVFLSWFWNSKKTVEAVLDEYAALYFGPEAKTGRKLLDLLDDSCRDPQRKQNIHETLAKLESSAPDWVKRDWRWNEIKASASRFGVPRNRQGLAKPRDTTTVASSEFSPDYHAGKASDGILSSQNRENFWASANNQDVGAWWQKDLGKKSPIGRIQIQFRGFNGRYHFVPKTITFQVSDDGKQWTTVVRKSADVPANNSAYDGKMHAYDVKAKGRYVRLLFEEGTDDTVGNIKVVELAEVKVIRAKASPADKRVTELPAESAGKPVRRIRVVLPDKAGSKMRKIAAVFGRQVSERCGARVTTNGEAPLRVELAIRPGIGKEGFSISKTQAGTIRITGNDPHGVLYGVGKFLRTSRFDAGGLTPGAWKGTSVPKKPIRGIYFATHFHNFYHDGPVEEIQRYVEELALWGCNSLMVWYDMHHFNGFKDPKAVAFRERLGGILQTATDLGLGTAFVVVGNEGYANSPRELRSAGGKRGAYFECQVCPSKPEGLEYILRIQTEMMDWMRPLKPQFLLIWPFDSGGCDCEKCRPWATNGFLKCAKPVAKLAREKLPGVKIILSNWFYRGNEVKELGKIISAEPPWIDLVMGPVPGTKFPAVNFPEISMLGVKPWGGYGATPVPQRLQKKYSGLANLIGGFPYSEGIFEDLNKVVMLQLYWKPDHPVVETLTEYAGFEFSPEVAADVVAMIKILEKNFPRKRIGADAIQAYELAQKVEARLSPRARASWRWRILSLRALIDREMHLKKGRLEGKVLKDAFAELTRMYHAKNALKGWLRPPQVK